MRWYAAFLFFGSPFCDRRVSVESQPAVVGLLEQVDEECWTGRHHDGAMMYGQRAVLRTQACQYVTEIYERRDGMHYTKEYNDCHFDYFMMGPCI